MAPRLAGAVETEIMNIGSSDDAERYQWRREM